MSSRAPSRQATSTREPELGFWGQRIEREQAAAVGRPPGWPRRVPPRSRLGLDPDRRAVRRWHRHARRRGGHRGVARAATRPPLPASSTTTRSGGCGSRTSRTAPSRRSHSPITSEPRAEQAVVVALVRASESADLERWVGRCLADTADVALPSRHLGVALRGARPGRRRPGAAPRVPREQELRPPPRVRPPRRGRRSRR